MEIKLHGKMNSLCFIEKKTLEFGDSTFWDPVKDLMRNNLLKMRSLYKINIAVITVFTTNVTFKNLSNKFANVLIYPNCKFL